MIWPNDQGQGSAEWLKRLTDTNCSADSLSVVWEGNLEAPVSENYQFSMYLTGTAKLFIDGDLILDTENSGSQLYTGLQSNVSGKATSAISKPVRLAAGKRVSIRIEWTSTDRIKERFLGYDGPMFHLNWESPMHDRLAIPTRFLYPK